MIVPVGVRRGRGRDRGPLDDPARARRMAVAARARIEERFTVATMVQRTAALYEECLRAAGATIPAASAA